jgi:hypothetical protein
LHPDEHARQRGADALDEHPAPNKFLVVVVHHLSFTLRCFVVVGFHVILEYAEKFAAERIHLAQLPIVFSLPFTDCRKLAL